MNTINLSWPIFTGFQNRNKISQAKIDTELLESRFAETENQIELQARIAEKNLESSIKTEEANKSSHTSSWEYYKMVDKQYINGQKTLLDILDARYQLTISLVTYTISHFETLIKLAELERANAGYNLNSIQN